MIKTILFATDLGLNTYHLLQHVNDMAEQYQAKVIVVHAVEPSGHLSSVVVQTYLSADDHHECDEFDISNIMEGIKYRIVDAFEEEYINGQQGLGHIRDVRVLQGKPADVILEQAIACQADMIMLGSHGESCHMPNLLGSVTSRVLQTSRTPVYMIPLAHNVTPQANTCWPLNT